MGGCLEPCQHHQARCFARSRRSQHGQEFPFANREVQIFDDKNFAIIAFLNPIEDDETVLRCVFWQNIPQFCSTPHQPTPCGIGIQQPTFETLDIGYGFPNMPMRQSKNLSFRPKRKAFAYTRRKRSLLRYFPPVSGNRCFSWSLTQHIVPLIGD